MRLALSSGLSLGEAIRKAIAVPAVRFVVVVLVIAALGFGSAVYARGDMAGTALGLAEITSTSARMWPPIVLLVVTALLLTGRYQIIAVALTAMVVVMGVVFLVTAIMVAPNAGDMLRGAFIPSVPEGSEWVTVGLTGTTVVGYNLFLHSSAALERYPRGADIPRSLRSARIDTVLSIGLGGLVTLAIIATAAAAFFAKGIEIDSAGTMATQLEPLLGPAAKYFFATGLFAAGLSSALAGGLAAAYAVSGTLGIEQNLSSRKFQAIWFAILLYGAIFATTGADPVAAILFAQAANGLLLPILAIVLLVVMNRSSILGRYRNTLWQNAISVIVVAVVIFLGAWSLLDLAGVIG